MKKNIKTIYKVIPQMFDIKPVDQDGNLDVRKFSKARKFFPVEKNKKNNQVQKNNFSEIIQDIRPESINDLEIRRFKNVIENEQEKEIIKVSKKITQSKEDPEPSKIYDYFEKEEKNHKISHTFSIGDFLAFRKYFQKLSLSKSLFIFSRMAVSICIFVIGVTFIEKGLVAKSNMEESGMSALVNLASAQEGIKAQDFQKSALEFNEAYKKFSQISDEFQGLGGFLADSTRFLPYFSKVSSGKNLAEAGQNISKLGILIGQIAQSLSDVENPLEENNQTSLLSIFKKTDANLKKSLVLIYDLEDNLSKINNDDIPEEKKGDFIALKEQLPEVRNYLANFSSNSAIFTDILGGNGPRKYLFLFQNNQEMRATGGFIGTYGILDIFNGRIRKFFVDGIFNPDGQLREKIIPPVPIQKISAAWSLHDSNWFPDFPKSAEKASWFYEKTGGPTVDGVITMTPNVMQKLLELTGPVDLPEYEKTITAENFVEEVQQQVEIDYDKEENRPKKILADLAPIILDRLFNQRNPEDLARTLEILFESLAEKHILIYSKNYEIEKKISEMGWSGEILESQKDYVSVINSNINGYKTDGVIDEKIKLSAEIQADGSIIDTLSITRHHNGGSEEHDWWNKVNADYMRVYVPKGSQLLSVEGQTREFNSPPLDYNALKFKNDPQLKMEEESMIIDEEGGTKISEDENKTVFGNWVYVSPQEEVTITYKYLLPIKVEVGSRNNFVDSYSLLAQKQSGSFGSAFDFSLNFPENYNLRWTYPNGMTKEGTSLKEESNLKEDKFFGAAFSGK
ncbi:MAG: hypothetical protein COU40_00990 [Candidatus Moranbacteria bacterium CG10_big_fil_rev_8_21_14_0_10_35_21]|nr:MAG: hypothetical protein COU40_00990 [Candidatus Moranbacteria bacterium CG10_big_fil_rev_8_21_14_0_10_35_21]PJA88675.1 MAG: hypothetical protein CO139_01775 [Candidatus Moranbacteria bacterium CG_4_9_14_3_um_filter_36_9]